MAPKDPCAKYQYVLTSSGPKIVPVPDHVPKEEESPADYNAGGYLPVKINDTFKDGRYSVVRKLGYAPTTTDISIHNQPSSLAGVTFLPFGWFKIPSAFHHIPLVPPSFLIELQAIPLFCSQGRQVRFPLCRDCPR
jgi:hypothetical protein